MTIDGLRSGISMHDSYYPHTVRDVSVETPEWALPLVAAPRIGFLAANKF